MSGGRRIPAPYAAPGMTLPELLIALALASVLALGLVQIASAASAADRLQRNQAEVLDRARFALGKLARAIRQAGFRPEPWNPAFAAGALADDNSDAVAPSGDRLSLRAWSDRNCFDNLNPDRDGAGRPRFYLRVQAFEVSAAGQLAHTCRYGPAMDALTTQIRRQGLLPGVETFQVLYGHDDDGDGGADGWVRAGQWSDPRRVLGLRIGLLLAGDDAVVEPGETAYDVLGDIVHVPADGRLRRLFEFTVAIRGRAG